MEKKNRHLVRKFLVLSLLLAFLYPFSASAVTLPGTTITLSSSSINAWVGDSATIVANIDFSTSAATDSVTVYTTVSSDNGLSQEVARLVVKDTSNVTMVNRLETTTAKLGFSDTITVTGASARESCNLT